jgi:hypothetical protein
MTSSALPPHPPNKLVRAVDKRFRNGAERVVVQFTMYDKEPVILMENLKDNQNMLVADFIELNVGSRQVLERMIEEWPVALVVRSESWNHDDTREDYQMLYDVISRNHGEPRME